VVKYLDHPYSLSKEKKNPPFQSALSEEGGEFYKSDNDIIVQGKTIVNEKPPP